MFISIIIPTYNVSSYISRCIDSCLNQTFREFEIIIIDDNSTDNTYDIIKEYQQNHSNILISRNNENKGVHLTRTLGIQKAIGEYVFLLDGDDFIPEHSLKCLYEMYSKTGADIIDGEYKFVDEENIEIDNNNNYSFNSILDSEEYLLILLKNKALYQTFKLIKKDLFINVKINQKLSIGEDAVSIVQILKEAKRIAKVDCIVYFYFRRSDSVTMNPNKKNLIDSYLSNEIVINELLSKNGRFADQIKNIRLNNIANYIFYFHIAGAYRSDFRIELIRNLIFLLRGTAKFSLKTRIAICVSLFSPYYANIFLRKKYSINL
jgi:glycosyltransferase involved in cell wall biosynthesis